MRSDESLAVFSNCQELVAVANVFNIKIHIFEYKGKDGRWSEIHPDPEMTSTAIMDGSWAPELFLYNNSNTHYDLLVRDESRFVDGLVGKVTENYTNEGWKTVPNKKHKTGENFPPGEKLLTEEANGNESEKELEEALTLIRGKEHGFRRASPQVDAEDICVTNHSFKCSQCDKTLESQGMLDAHTQVHKSNIHECDSCGSKFQMKSDLEIHVKSSHREVINEQYEWNCNDCSFQASEPSELINHLKLKAHQPSEHCDKKQLFKEYKRCYTCNLEVDGYYNLMNHRKEKHPSNRKCRYFPDGKCHRGSTCWFVHAEDLMDVDESFSKVDPVHKCYICGNVFKTKDGLKKHRKNEHPENIQVCEKFISKKCDRTDEECWYKHKLESTPSNKQSQVFHEVPSNPPPPEHMKQMLEAINSLSLKIETMGKRFEELMN